MTTGEQRSRMAVVLVTAFAAALAAGACGPTSVAPLEVSGVTGVTAIAIGVGQTCVIVEGGGVRCLGTNTFGELGNGTSSSSKTAQTVIGTNGEPFGDVEELEAFENTTCGRVGPSTWSCWGDDPLGVLETSKRDRATEVPFLRGATAMTLGGGERLLSYSEPGATVDPANAVRFAYVCGAFDDAVRCRTARRSQIDADTRYETFDLPIGRARVLRSGQGVFCALTETADVLCNAIDTMERRPVESTPTATCDEELTTCEEGTEETRTRVVEVTGVLALKNVGHAGGLDVGAQHACVLTVDLEVECLGLTESGEAGKLGLGEPRVGRTLVNGIGYVVTLALGDGFSCGLTRSGEVRCWGNNSARQLGSDAVSFTTETPVLTRLPAPATAIGAGRQHACAAVGSDRQLFCWGSSHTLPF